MTSTPDVIVIIVNIMMHLCLMRTSWKLLVKYLKASNSGLHIPPLDYFMNIIPFLLFLGLPSQLQRLTVLSLLTSSLTGALYN